MSGDRLTICIAENRQSCEPALRILIASLSRHCPGTSIVLFCPAATETFCQWVSNFPQCSLNPYRLNGIWTKYDIKPLALMSVLNAGAADVVWIDSDILVARDFRPTLAALSSDTLAVAEEALSGSHVDPDGLRARLWGMAVGRVLPFAVNTGVLRVTTAHLALLETWHSLLQSDTYRTAQALPWTQRQPHVAGDQEVMTALLASERFAAIPIEFLRRGRDIIQFFGSSGYTIGERLRHLQIGMPAFVHSQGFHPWWPRERVASGQAARFNALYAALSPYTTLARGYAEVLEHDDWLRPTSAVARIMSTRSAPLTGLPLAAVADAVRLAKRVASRWHTAKHRPQPTRASASDA